jgi:hypothetical protein
MDFGKLLKELSMAEKLALMEVLWEDLRCTPDVIPSPVWHAKVLAEREKQIESGEAKFIDFEEMCERIRKETQCET